MPEPSDGFARADVRKATIATYRAEAGAERAAALIGEAEELRAKLSRKLGQIAWMFENRIYERAEFGGLARSSAVNTLLDLTHTAFGTGPAFELGFCSDFESIIAGLAADAGAPSR